jgi:hypothetical protein
MPKQSGKPKKPPPKPNGPLRIDLPFEDAVRAALEVPPEREAKPRKRHRTS